MQKTLVLGYWRIRGIAQPIRYLLEYMRLPYSERIYDTQDEWYSGDAKSPEFSNHILLNLPYIKDDNTYIYESGAIIIYLVDKAQKQELLGITIEEQIAIAQIQEIMLASFKAFREIRVLPKQEFNEQGINKFNSNCLHYITKLDTFLQGKHWSAGDRLTTADFCVFEFAETLKCFSEETFNKYAQICRLHSQFTSIPEIQAYLASDRFIARPFYPSWVGSWG